MGNAPGPKPFLGHPQACVIGNRCNRVVATLWLSVCVCESVGLWVWWGNTGVYDSCAGQTKSCSNRVWGGAKNGPASARAEKPTTLPFLAIRSWGHGKGRKESPRAHTHARSPSSSSSQRSPFPTLPTSSYGIFSSPWEVA